MATGACQARTLLDRWFACGGGGGAGAFASPIGDSRTPPAPYYGTFGR
jgi:hypothetical protein